MNLLLLCLNYSILLCTAKVWPVGMIARKICSIIHYTTGHFIPRKYLSLVFYDNRNLKISKSKKAEQYFRDKIEIFIWLFDEHFARHFESHSRETWRHTGKRTVPQISLETPSPLDGWPLLRCQIRFFPHPLCGWLFDFCGEGAGGMGDLYGGPPKGSLQKKGQLYMKHCTLYK